MVQVLGGKKKERERERNVCHLVELGPQEDRMARVRKALRRDEADGSSQQVRFDFVEHGAPLPRGKVVKSKSHAWGNCRHRKGN